MSPILTGVIASGISGNLTPPWSPEGAYDSLAVVTASGSLSSITFAGIPSGYSHLQIRQMMRTDFAASDIGWTFRFNGDTGNNYSTHSLYGTGSSTVASAAASTNYINVGFGIGTTVASNILGVSIVDILDYANSSKFKTTRSIFGNDRNGSGTVGIMSGSWRNTEPINSITILAGAGNFTTNSTFALYGVK
jgi:hypothetical protein